MTHKTGNRSTYEDENSHQNEAGGYETTIQANLIVLTSELLEELIRNGDLDDLDFDD